MDLSKVAFSASLPTGFAEVDMTTYCTHCGQPYFITPKGEVMHKFVHYTGMCDCGHHCCEATRLPLHPADHWGIRPFVQGDIEQILYKVDEAWGFRISEEARWSFVYPGRRL